MNTNRKLVTTACDFAADRETGDFVFSARAGRDPGAALRQAETILDGAGMVVDGLLRNPDSRSDEVMALLAFAMEAAGALVCASERGLSSNAAAADAVG